MKIKHIATGLALLAMPFTAQAEVREAGLVDGFGMSLIYPAVHTKNIAAENAINKDITGYVRRMKELYESGEKQEVYMTYTTKYEDEDLVSIVLETSSINEGMADRNAQAYGLVYNKKTGDLLDKSKFGVKVDSAEVVNLLKEESLTCITSMGKSYLMTLSSSRPHTWRRSASSWEERTGAALCGRRAGSLFGRRDIRGDSSEIRK